MNGVWDFDQPAKHWLVDVIENLGTLMDNDGQPSMTLTINGVEFEFRLKPESAEQLRTHIPPAEKDLPYCGHCGAKKQVQAGPSGIFYGCSTVTDQSDADNGYCPGYWEFHLTGFPARPESN